MDAILIIVAIVALGFGALVGWLLGSRGGEQGRATAESLRMQLDEVVKERDSNRAAVQELAAFRAAQVEREKAFEEKVAELSKAREELSAQFAEVGGKLLESAQKQFLERADQRFRQSEESAGTNLKALLQPVHERLQRYEEAVTKVEEERRKDFGLLSAARSKQPANQRAEGQRDDCNDDQAGIHRPLQNAERNMNISAFGGRLKCRISPCLGAGCGSRGPA